MGPVLEEHLLVPQESIQVRRPKVADPAPEDEDMRRCDHADRVPLNLAEVADDGDDRFLGRTRWQLACEALFRHGQTPHGFQGHRDGCLTQLVRLPISPLLSL